MTLMLLIVGLSFSCDTNFSREAKAPSEEGLTDQAAYN